MRQAAYRLMGYNFASLGRDGAGARSPTTRKKPPATPISSPCSPTYPKDFFGEGTDKADDQGQAGDLAEALRLRLQDGPHDPGGEEAAPGRAGRPRIAQEGGRRRRRRVQGLPRRLQEKVDAGARPALGSADTRLPLGAGGAGGVFLRHRQRSAATWMRVAPAQRVRHPHAAAVPARVGRVRQFRRRVLPAS